MRAPSWSERLVQEQQATRGAMAAHPLVVGLADGTPPAWGGIRPRGPL
jgi:hypothetical protein